MGQVNNNTLLSARILDWVSKSMGTGAVIESVNKLAGSTSSSLYSMEIAYQTKKMELVLRLLDNTSWLLEEPDLALHEAESLKWPFAAQLLSPEWIAFDPNGEYCGIPAVLMSKLPGSVVLQPNHMAQWLQEMATFLVRLHEVEAGSFGWKYFTYHDIKQLTIPEWSNFPTEWGKVIRILHEERPMTVERFIHRDFHPANVLWVDNKVSGIVDWINACRDPGWN